jgi:hypothetical protein
MHLSKVNEALSHRITGGSDYQWGCYGPNVRFLDFESEYAHASVVFDTATQEVYEATIDSKNESTKPYRWISPEFKYAYLDEAKERGVDPQHAWDNVKWIDLEVHEDFLTKAEAIFNGEDFDTRVQVPLELEREELYRLMTMAHERDITLNELVEDILWNVIKSEKKNSTYD